MIQLLPGLRIKVSNKHSTYGRVKVKTIQLFLGKYIAWSFGQGHLVIFDFWNAVICSLYINRIFIYSGGF